MNYTEKVVPLIERLRQVPSDARLIVEEDYFSSSSHPVGPLAHEAAAEIERLREEVLAEREACAKVAEEATSAWTKYEFNRGCMYCAKAIRARGEKEQPR